MSWSRSQERWAYVLIVIVCVCLFFLRSQVATRLCPDGIPRVWCDFQQCIPVDEIFRGTAVQVAASQEQKTQAPGVAADDAVAAAEQLSLGKSCLLIVLMLGTGSCQLRPRTSLPFGVGFSSRARWRCQL
jgi:hypothetical protein